MDEDKFGIAVRKFLKEVGVTSQRQIEKAVRDAVSAGKLQGSEVLDAKMTLEIRPIGLTYVVNGRIGLE